jgi:hypothetical protein
MEQGASRSVFGPPPMISSCVKALLSSCSPFRRTRDVPLACMTGNEAKIDEDLPEDPGKTTVP